MRKVTVSRLAYFYGYRVLLGFCAMPLSVTALSGRGADEATDPELKPVEQLSDITGSWSLESEPDIWLTVEETGEVNGSRGGTQFSSTDAVEGSQLHFGEFWSDAIQCGEQVDKAWDELVAGLDDPVVARVGGGRRTLNDESVFISKDA